MMFSLNRIDFPLNFVKQYRIRVWSNVNLYNDGDKLNQTAEGRGPVEGPANSPSGFRLCFRLGLAIKRTDERTVNRSWPRVLSHGK